MKVVIVGGVAGGATAAARLRRLDEQAEIVVFERSGFISYANCGLPYYIGDVITDPQDLTLQTPESFFSRFRVNMKVRHEVTALHPEKHTVSVKNLKTGEEFEESYDKLILSPGAKPTQPPVPGTDLKKLFTLRTVEDTLSIKRYINRNHPKPEKHTVSVKNLKTGEEFEESYDKLILSPGAKPTQPPVPGTDLKKLFTLRTVEDTLSIKRYINRNHPKSAILAGGGFIGLEVAENLRELGMDVTIVQRPKQLMKPFAWKIPLASNGISTETTPNPQFWQEVDLLAW